MALQMGISQLSKYLLHTLACVQLSTLIALFGFCVCVVCIICIDNTFVT